MIAVLSPAKRLVEGPADPSLPHTTPALAADAASLAEMARRLDAADLQGLMGISPKLAELNVERFRALRLPPDPSSARQAVRTFAGDVYVGLDADTLDAADLAFAQEHLAILSGLFGVLRPLDLVPPYRLEMGTRLQNTRGADLYAFWGDRVARELLARLDGHADRTVVNLASQEYFGAVDRRALDDVRVVTPVFRDVKDGRSRVISFYAKKARGSMARFLVRGRLQRADDLRAFDGDGYRFVPERSDDVTWVFERPQPPPVAAGRA